MLTTGVNIIFEMGRGIYFYSNFTHFIIIYNIIIVIFNVPNNVITFQMYPTIGQNKGF